MEEVLFAAATFLVLPFWLLMIALPGWRWTQAVMKSPLVLLPLPLLYAVLLALFGQKMMALVLDPARSLATVIADVLGQPEGATIAWIHLLAFDLFVGRWEYLDAQERGYGGVITAPALWATLLVGPLGLLFYLGLRSALGDLKAAKSTQT